MQMMLTIADLSLADSRTRTKQKGIRTHFTYVATAGHALRLLASKQHSTAPDLAARTISVGTVVKSFQIRLSGIYALSISIMYTSLANATKRRSSSG